eukprot:270329_1
MVVWIYKMWALAYRKDTFRDDQETTNAVEGVNNGYKFTTLKWQPNKSLTEQIQGLLYFFLPKQEVDYNRRVYQAGPDAYTIVSDRIPDEFLYHPKCAELMTNKLRGEEFPSESIEEINKDKGIYNVW